MKGSKRSGFTVVVCIIVAAVCLAAGLVLGSSPVGQSLMRLVLPANLAHSWLLPKGEFPLQAEVLNRVEQTYYKPVDRAALEENAIRGMLAGLEDPYTSYFNPDEYAELKVLTEGSYSGVGVLVEMQAGFVTVVSTFRDSPAERAGIKPGDVIVAVEDQPTQGLSLDRVVAKIKGPEGTDVKLKIYRLPAGAKIEEPEVEGAAGELPSGGETLDLVLTREAITPPVLESKVVQEGGSSVGYIQFFTFSEGSSEQLRAAVREFVETEQVDAVVLDLRSNGGGLVDEAVGVASVFLPKDALIATVEGLHTPKETLVARGDGYPDIPLYVLTDEYSASSAEIVAGALKDNNRATIVGATTFGKGLIQSIQALPNGGAVKITAAVYLTPSGSDINGKGIEPNVTAPDDPATTDVDETLQTALGLIAQAR